MTFQTQVQNFQAPAVAGDFASENPRSTVIANGAALVAAAAGLVIGNFAWYDPLVQVASNTPGPGASTKPNGFVARTPNMGFITAYLGSAGMTVQGGYPVTLHSGGDFWAVNSGTADVQPGMKAFANLLDGTMTFAAAGTNATTGSGSASTIAAATGVSSAASTISGTTFTTGPSVTGTIYPGTVLTGTGVQTGTTVVKQLTGTTGGVGTYEVNIDQVVASTTISGTCGVLTVGGTVTGVFEVGALVTGTGVTTGTKIWGLGTGTGGAGTYYVSPSQAVSSTAISATTNVETDWYARSNAQAGELVVISSHAIG